MTNFQREIFKQGFKRFKTSNFAHLKVFFFTNKGLQNHCGNMKKVLKIWSILYNTTTDGPRELGFVLNIRVDQVLLKPSFFTV
jgi:hypothetical protein